MLVHWVAWIACVSGCGIELTNQVTSSTVEAAIQTQLKRCPAPDALLLKQNNLSSLPETTVYIQFAGECAGEPLLVDELNVSECQELCTNRSNCSYVLVLQNNCSLFVATSCHPNNMSSVQIHRKDTAFAFAKNLTTLRYLDLSDNKFTTLPSLRGLRALTKLDLSSNRISSLPADLLSTSTQLEVLNLQQNQLETLPSNIFQPLSNLNTLSLFGNRLTALSPNVFSRLSHLKALFLSTNRLRSLPNGIFSSLKELIFLDFGANPIEALPNALFHNLTRLQVLYFANTSLAALPADIFRGLLNLKDLRFCDSPVKQLPSGVFGGLGLTRLEACNCELTEVPEDAFWNLPLTTLRLSNNKIKSLKPNTFQGLSRLVWLELQGNLLFTLPETIFQSLTSLNYLPLGDPPGCTNRVDDCTGVVKVGSYLQAFRVTPNSVSTTSPTVAPSKSLAPSSVPSSSAPPLESSDLPAWGITLIVLAVALLLCFGVVVVYCWVTKHQNQQSKPPKPQPSCDPVETQGQQVALIERSSPPSVVPPYGSPKTQKLVSVHYVAGPSQATPSPPPATARLNNYDSPAHQEDSPAASVFTKGDCKYSVVRTLGKGHFGTAYLVMDPNMQVLVLKAIACSKSPDVIKEAKTLALNTPTSPHLLKVLDFFFETSDVFCIVTNYCRGGSLADEIARALEPHEIERVLREIAAGLECLHASKLVHRDLKPDNVFLQDPSSRTVVIGDMGMARLVDASGFYQSWFGHMLYKAPEIESNGLYSARSDMWAVGCIGLELLSGVPMKERHAQSKLCLGKCGQAEIEALLESLPENSRRQNCYKMICGLLMHDPEKRLTATELKNFPPEVGDYSDPTLLAQNRGLGSPESMSPGNSPLSEGKPLLSDPVSASNNKNNELYSRSEASCTSCVTSSTTAESKSSSRSHSSRLVHTDSNSVHGAGAFYDSAQLSEENRHSVHPPERPLVQPWDLAGFSYR